MITFIKILPYDLHPAGVDEFAYRIGIAEQKIDPPSRAPSKLEITGGSILHSPLRRCRECITLSDTVSMVSLESLREVLFGRALFGERDAWKKERSRLIRRNFKHAFIADSLPAKRKQLMAEVCEILGACLTAASQAPVSVVSHSFRLKLIEAFVKTNGSLFKEPELIHTFISDTHKTYAFGERFAFGQDVIAHALHSSQNH